MLIGELVQLRARISSDVQPLHAGLYDDVATRSRTDSRPWRPISPGPDSPFAVLDERTEKADIFSVVESAGGQLAGAALLWGIDQHNRFAHLGISLLPEFRGRGLAADTIRVLCRYGFQTRGLHRLQLETLADNEQMIRTAQAVGFSREGTIREAAWIAGQFLDEVIFGLLAGEWQNG